jgi:hypothetical protein
MRKLAKSVPRASQRWLRTLACWLTVVVLVFAAAPAQTAPQSSPPTSTPPAQEHRISPEEAQQLLRSVDDVLQFDSENTGLPIRKDVKRALAGRQQVQDYIHSRIRDDEDAERLRSAASVLKKFGLLPRDFRLESFLVELMGEQVAGYYDTKSKTVYLLNWLPPETQQPVLAHELVHALQDQNYGIEEWVRKAEVRNRGAEKQIASDEALAARHAVVEGQAMAVMVDFLLAPIHGSLVNSPLMAKAIQQGMLQGSDSPVLARTPLYIRQLLLFPYSYGLNFVRELLLRHGKRGAYVDVFRNPPESTRQIMQPETYLAGEKLPPLRVPGLDRTLGPGYQPLDIGSVGQFDVSVMVQQFSPDPDTNNAVGSTDHSVGTPRAGVDGPVRPAAARDGSETNGNAPLWTHWRGGYYYAARRKPAPGVSTATAEVPPSDIALIYVSRWDTPEAAAEFARIYAASVERRYTGVRSSSSSPGNCSDCPLARFDGLIAFETDEGPVSIEAHGDLVLAIESFPPATAEKIRTAVFEANR